MGSNDLGNVRAASGLHSVWGRVIDANGNPVPRAEVYWVAAEHGGRETVELYETHWVALADADGRFWAPGLPSGPGLLVPDLQRTAVAGDKVRIGDAMRVTLPLPEGELVVPFPHMPNSFAAIRGRLQDQVDGSPLVGHVVLLGTPTGAVLRQTATGPDGTFGFGFLQPGKYLIAAVHSVRHVGGAGPAELAGGQTANVQLGLPRREPGPRHVVRVQVEDELGLPVGGVPVQFSMPDFQPVIVPTDEEGVAQASDLPVRPDKVMVGVLEFSPRGTLVPPGEPGVPIDLGISLQRTVRMQVAVRDAETGKALRHANICVSHGGGDYWNWGGVLPPPGAPQKDHQDVVVLPGRVTVRAESPGYESGRQEIEIVPGVEPPTVVLDLAPRAA